MNPIKQGENSARVKLLQGILNVIIGCGLVEDGVYGNLSVQAVERYQSIMKIGIDGVVGVETISTLLTDIKNNWFHCS